jgi:hypothetical protein
MIRWTSMTQLVELPKAGFDIAANNGHSPILVRSHQYVTYLSMTV